MTLTDYVKLAGGAIFAPPQAMVPRSPSPATGVTAPTPPGLGASPGVKLPAASAAPSPAVAKVPKPPKPPKPKAPLKLPKLKPKLGTDFASHVRHTSLVTFPA